MPHPATRSRTHFIRTSVGYREGYFSPAFSPDGRALAFAYVVTIDASDILVQNLDGQLQPDGEPWPLVSGAGRNRSAVWLPGTNEILFVSGNMQQSSVFRIPVTPGAKPVPVPDAGRGIDALAVSSDGSRMAFTRGNWHRSIWRAPLGGAGEPAPFLASSLEDTMPDYSPDGRRIAFSSARSGHREIWASDADGLTAVKLTNLKAALSSAPSWSPDGRHIAFDANPEEHRDIYVVNSEGGGLRRVVSGPTNATHPSWSRDGQSIYFRSNRSGQRQIWKVPSEGGDAEQVTTRGGSFAKESTDGRFLYVQAGGRALRRMPADGGDGEQIAEVSWGQSVVVFEDSVYFVTGDVNANKTLKRFDLGANTVSSVLEFSTPWTTGFSISPDKKMLLFTRRESSGSDLVLVENFQ